MMFIRKSPANDPSESTEIVKNIEKYGNDLYGVCHGRFLWFLVIGTNFIGQIYICQLFSVHFT